MTKINLNYLQDLGGGDNDFIIDMLNTYLDETGRDVQNMLQSLREQDWKRIGFLAHRSKSAFRMIGLQQLNQDTEALEELLKENPINPNAIEKVLTQIIDTAKNSFEQAQKEIDRLSKL